MPYVAGLEAFDALDKDAQGLAARPEAERAIETIDGMRLLFECSLLMLEFANDLVGDLIPRRVTTPRRLGRKPTLDAKATELAARRAQATVDAAIVRGFIVGMAMTGVSGDVLAVQPDIAIYPDVAMRWYWKTARQSVVAEIDADREATDLLAALARDDVARIALLAVTVEQELGRAADQQLAMALAFEVAKQGVVLFRAHTATIQDRFADDHLAWVTSQVADRRT